MAERATLAAVLAGDRRAVARALSEVEDEPSGDLAAAAFVHGGRAHVVGVTGPPGSGKSTLVSAAVGELRARGRTVGVLAVDPSSPFTGGAVLGDRVRMAAHAGDDGVFIRSMASRGSVGGLARAASGAVGVLDAAGYEVVIVETVGAGQAEVEIADEAHTTVVVVVPGAGDAVQALKAGILEIGDVFAVNKADLPGADRAVGDLITMLGAGARGSEGGWRPPVVRTVATTGDGVAALVDAVAEHEAFLRAGGGWCARERARAAAELRRELHARLVEPLLDRDRDGAFDGVLDRLARRELGPREALAELMGRRSGREMVDE